MGTLNELVYIIPDLIDLFLSGFIFVNVYLKLNNKKMDISLICLWSLFISYIIKVFYASLHLVLLTNYNFPEEVKIIIYVLTGFITPSVLTKLMKTNAVRNILLSINYQTVNESIFDDLIDYEESTGMAVYLKESDFYYLGIFCLKDEDDSYISLIDYVRVDNKTDEVIYEPTQPTVVAIHLNDIERIEFIYADTSKTWKKLQQGNKKSD